ncbi:acriflavin resistance protein F [Salmonella enterica subsp. enterica]|uniref:Acriflavin resistance protein F n=1 Tax=Salmonella enterica I TaxID=59201 RepID=A0A3S4FHQ6_SALET|nr:acriflavin resistance protein F [Salmonella enterica subsp. enterica]
MSQIQGALVGIAMVLSAVFIPMAFFGGSTGAIYRQFFYYYCFSNGAIRSGCVDSDASAVRYAA